ncbi:MAG: DNA methylase, partial [Lachnospiraceae bacterium]|nr:DNA methylase [Lachnospiraceae bacterium]
VLTVGYDVENLKNAKPDGGYQGEIVADYYGRLVPKHAHGTENLKEFSSSAKEISEAVLAIFDRVLDPTLLVRRINVAANHVISESEAEKKEKYEQLDLFRDFAFGNGEPKQDEKDKERLQREKKMQQAILGLQKRYGKNAVLKGTDLEEGATTRERNGQIGGHKA